MNSTVLNIERMSVQFLVSDLERSIDFYTNTLGFEVEFRYETFYVGLIKNGYSIHLKLGKPLRNTMENDDVGLLFSVTDIDKTYTYLQSRPAMVVQGLRQRPYGKEFYIADPDGYVLAFFQETVV